MEALYALPAGVFFGALAGFIGFFVLELFREARSNGKSMAIPAGILIAYFGAAIWGMLHLLSANEWQLVWFVATAWFVVRRFYRQDD